MFNFEGNVLLEIGNTLAVNRILRKGAPLTRIKLLASYTYTLVPAFSAAMSRALIPKGFLVPIRDSLFLARVISESRRPVKVALILDRVNDERIVEDPLNYLLIH